MTCQPMLNFPTDKHTHTFYSLGVDSYICVCWDTQSTQTCTGKYTHTDMLTRANMLHVACWNRLRMSLFSPPCPFSFYLLFSFTYLFFSLAYVQTNQSSPSDWIKVSKVLIKHTFFVLSSLWETLAWLPWLYKNQAWIAPGGLWSPFLW